MFDIDKITRKNIRELVPYSSARTEHEDTDAILLDANENPFNHPYNRYPDPLQKELKKKIAEKISSSQHTAVSSQQIFIGNGSDEAIDLLIRAFCEPAINNLIIPEPSYGMYEVCAQINNVKIKKVLLKKDFQLDVDRIIDTIDKNSKLIFICSPNNPTSNSFRKEDVLKIIEAFEGIVVIDEAYIDFSENESYLKYLDKYPNLVILQTFSKAKAMAGVRLGMAFASEDIINVLNKIKYPYNVNILTQQYAIDMFDNEENDDWIKIILNERKKLEKELTGFGFVEKVFPSDANFLLVKVKQPGEIYKYLVSKGIVVRDRSGQALCEGCLRITAGTPEENVALIEAMKEYEK